MKFSTAALSLLILAAALGSQARVIHDLEKRQVLRIPIESPIQHGILQEAADCCFSYTRRRIRCTFMKDYFETSSGCSQPGVIFFSRKGQRICADPNDGGVQECMANLNLK
ncbi:C-C motif chemokine 15 [Marmota monax]|uniref:C-C motif chemokine n=1 Tax=Marmota monax TaxID=9995 RepID=A0A834QFE4_MARMO|nr:C-C motif chemokine 15 [Marmota monax]KAF7477408.1 C-C motif chemokine 15-like [Marmota monax]